MFDMREILQTARSEHASDIYLVAGIPPQMRIDGSVKAAGHVRLLPGDTLEAVLRVMNEEQRNRFEECGSYDLTYAAEDLGRFRVSVYKQQGAVAMTLHPIWDSLPGAEILGIPEEVIKLGERQQGLVLFAGKAGSGKTTTMAAVIEEICRSRQVHVMTLENPVEYLHGYQRAVISQRELHTDFEDYTAALGEALRAGADVVMVDHVTTPETVKAICRTASAGCLVFASLCACGCIEAVEALIDLFPEGEKAGIRGRLAEILTAVVCQQSAASDGADRRTPEFQVLIADKTIKEFIRSGR